MMHYEELLKNWCDELIRLQIRGYGAPHDGGFLCPACTAVHGRADNAVLPFIYVYDMTGEEKYLTAAKEVVRFQTRLMLPGGEILNDSNNPWKGITVFSLMMFYHTLTAFKTALPADFSALLEARLGTMGDWAHENIVPGFGTNINYYAAAAACNAMTGTYFDKSEHLVRARQMLDYCMERFTENGLLVGEGYPHDEVTKRGCKPVDIGYNVEESVPCLVEAAEILGDEESLKKLAALSVKCLDFMLPDGAWDNSFGCRNNKWTYYGSRTSDGAATSLIKLSKYEPVLMEAALRNLELIERCSDGKQLYGGLEYKKLGQEACSHHLFSHGAGLTEALMAMKEKSAESGETAADEVVESKGEAGELSFGRGKLPYEDRGDEVKHYPEIDTYVIRKNGFIGTVTGYDYKTYTWKNGAAHASGGALSLLYHPAVGPVIAGSTYEYKQTEPLNMQYPMGARAHRTLIVRGEIEQNGAVYTTCLDPDSEITVTEKEEDVTVVVKAAFADLDGVAAEGTRFAEPARADITYRFLKECVEISFRSDLPAKWILPVREDTMTVSCVQETSVEPIYYLAGGFAMNEYTVCGTCADFVLKLPCEGGMK